MSLKERMEKKRIDHENYHLYSKIVKLNQSRQFGYLGLQNKSTEAERIIEAGLKTDNKKNKNPPLKVKSILERDRFLYGLGGHSSKALLSKSKQIDDENAQILSTLAR